MLQMQGLLRTIYPPRCVSCDTIVGEDGGLCGTCYRDMPFIAGTICDLCGTPLPGSEASEAHCDDCLKIARPWNKGRAALLYQDRARSLVLGLKHADRSEIVRPAAKWMFRAARDLIEDEAILTPIPLHWTRLLKRRFNQSAMLTREVARLAALPHIPDLLLRTRNTGSQEGRNQAERFTNMVDAISVPTQKAERIKGKSIILIDDVMTSGATLGAATETLLFSGAEKVSVLTLARVTKKP